MIRYDLICACGHRFDAWFSSSAAYDEQRQAGLVECPLCGGTDVRKQLMTPALASGASRRQRKEPRQTARLNDETARAARALLRALHAHVRENADYVGRDFAEEARRRAPLKNARPVWGEATREDVRELAEEGIEVMPLPPLPDEKN